MCNLLFQFGNKSVMPFCEEGRLGIKRRYYPGNQAITPKPKMIKQVQEMTFSSTKIYNKYWIIIIRVTFAA